MKSNGQAEVLSDDDEVEWGYAPPTDRQLRVNGQKFSYYKAVVQKRQRRSVLFCLPVMDPLGNAAFWWGIITTLIDMTYTAFIVPVSVAFSTLGEKDFLTLFDLLGNIVYFLDLLMGFCIGFVVFWGARWLPITDGRLVAWHYVRHGSFAINLIVMLPIVLQALMLAFGKDTEQTIQLVFMLRLLRVTRVVSVIKSLSRPGESSSMGRVVQGWLSATRLMVFTAVFTMLVLLNLLGCLWWTIARAEGLENSWAAQVSKKQDLLTAGDTTRYLFSVYFVMTTMTTIGYGDITPWTDVEMFVVLFYMVVGVGFFSYLINVVAELINASQPKRAAAAVQDRLRALDEWTARQELPQKLRRKVRKYFLRRWMQDAEADEGEYYAQMPPSLRALVRPRLLSQTLVQSEILSNLSKESRERLQALITAHAIPVSVFPGQVLYSKGDPTAHFYILDEGIMTASSGTGWCRPASFSGPAMIGLPGLFGPDVPEYSQHWQTATAVTGCHLWRLECCDVVQHLHERHAEVLLEVALLLKERLSSALQNARQHKWDAPGALTRQRRAMARMEAAFQGLAKLCDSLAAAAQDQERNRKEEAEEAVRGSQASTALLLQPSAAPTASTLSSVGHEGGGSRQSVLLELPSANSGGNRGSVGSGADSGGRKWGVVMSASQRVVAQEMEMLEVLQPVSSRTGGCSSGAVPPDVDVESA